MSLLSLLGLGLGAFVIRSLIPYEKKSQHGLHQSTRFGTHSSRTNNGRVSGAYLKNNIGYKGNSSRRYTR